MENGEIDSHNRTPTRLSRCLEGISASVHKGISQYFWRHGAVVSQYPWTVIVLSLLLSATTTGLYFKIMKRDSDARALFTPKTAVSFHDKDIYEDMFGIPPSQTRILITRKGDLRREGNCTDRALWNDTESARRFLSEMMVLFDEIWSLEIEYEHESYGLDDICLRPKPNSPCSVMTVVDVWNRSMETLQQDPDPIQTLTGQTGFASSQASFLLGVGSDGSECDETVEAVQNWILLHEKPERVGGGRYDPRNREWNLRLMHFLLNEWHSDEYTAYVNNLDAVQTESQKQLTKDTRLLWAAYAAVLTYCHIALFRNSYTHCKSHLAIISCISVVMAIYTAYGVAQIFGVPYNPVHRVLPFLLMGLGVDDTFVILSAYDETDVTMSVQQRLQLTSIRAGSSILVTSVTDFVAFLTGTFTTLNGLRDFAIYAAIGILFDFLYQVTFFIAFLVLEARRERQLYEKAIADEQQPLNATFDCPDNVQLNYDRPEGNNNANGIQFDSEDECISLSNRSIPFHKKILGSGYYKHHPSFSSRLVGQWIPRVTLSRWGRVVVLCLEMVLLCFSIYGCAHVKMDFRYEEWFVPDGSSLQVAMQLEKEYFLGNQVPFQAVTRETYPHAHFDAQRDLLRFGQALRDDLHVAKQPPIVSWYEGFVQYAETVASETQFVNGTFLDEAAFVSVLHRFLDGPGEIFTDDVVFDAEGTSLKATRIAAFTKGIGSGWSAVRTIDSIRNTVKATAPTLNPIAYSYAFIYYDGYRVIAWETIRNVLIAATAVFAMTLIILANFWASVSVLLMVVLTDVMLFGIMWYLDLTFNGVTCICLVLAVGLAVDYSVHIAHSFLVVTGNREERAKQSLYRIGGAVLNGAFTTGLSVALLSIGRHYIFQTFFKIFIAIVICGVWHGLIILPILLSFIGPDPYIKTNNNDEIHL